MVSASLVQALGLENLNGQADLDLSTPLPAFDSPEPLLHLRAAFTDRPPTSTRLPVSYQLIPSPLRRTIARTIGLMKRNSTNQWARFPRWPVDLSADFVSDLCGATRPAFTEGPTPVILTHDIDTLEGLGNLVDMFLPIEEDFGAHSTNYIVPFAWPLDHSLLGQIVDRGHGIGIHGFDHANQTPFCSPERRRERLEAAKPLMDQYSITGYRSPSLLRTKELLGDLAEIYTYDSSIPTTGGLFPVPNTGCATARPFKFDGILEIPISMPRDASMRFLSYSPARIFQMWRQTAEFISRSGGVVVLLTHCEKVYSGNKPMLETYRRFLEFLADSETFRWSTPEELFI